MWSFFPSTILNSEREYSFFPGCRNGRRHDTILITVRGLFRNVGWSSDRWEPSRYNFYIETRNSLGGYNSKYRKAGTCKGLQF